MISRYAQRVTAALATIIVLGAVGAVCFPAIAAATGTTVNVNIHDGLPARITITRPEDDSVVTTPEIILKGTVHNVSQIRAFVDDIYMMTVPLNSGASQYSFSLSITEGTHGITLEATNPFDGTTVEERLTATYTPSATPIPQSTPGGGASVPAEQLKQAAVDSSAYMQGQVDQASHTKPIASLSAVLYDWMVLLDLAPHGAGRDAMNRMVMRMILTVVGLVLIVFARSTITLYRWLRYRLLRWKIHALPTLVRHHAVLVLRILGVILLVASLFFLP